MAKSSRFVINTCIELILSGCFFFCGLGVDLVYSV